MWYFDPKESMPFNTHGGESIDLKEGLPEELPEHVQVGTHHKGGGEDWVNWEISIADDLITLRHENDYAIEIQIFKLKNWKVQHSYHKGWLFILLT